MTVAPDTQAIVRTCPAVIGIDAVRAPSPLKVFCATLVAAPALTFQEKVLPLPSSKYMTLQDVLPAGAVHVYVVAAPRVMASSTGPTGATNDPLPPDARVTGQVNEVSPVVLTGMNPWAPAAPFAVVG